MVCVAVMESRTWTSLCAPAQTLQEGSKHLKIMMAFTCITCTSQL